MPVHELTPWLRSGGDPWRLYILPRIPASCVSDANSGHYSGGLPSFAWAANGAGSLLESVQVAGDSSTAQVTITSGATRYLLTEFSGITFAAGQTVGVVDFTVTRWVPVGGSRQVTDLHVYLTKNGTPLTAIDKKKAGNWAKVASNAAEVVTYRFTGAELTTLGVTVADLASGTVGLAIQATSTGSGSVVANISGVAIHCAYSAVRLLDLDFTEIPGASNVDSPWQRLYDWRPAVPWIDTVHGIEVDLTAWTDEAAAVAHAPEHVPTGPYTGEVGSDYLYWLEVALSLDGVTPLAGSWVIFTTTAQTTHTVGGPADLWGDAWLPATFGGGFSVLIRRPAQYSAVESQYVSAARVRVTTETPQSNNMATRQELTELVLLGAEDTPGTQASTFRRMRALNYKVRPNFNVKQFTPQGEKLVDVVVPTREWATGTIDGLADYNELPHILEALLGPGVHGGTGNANERNYHQYNLENFKRSTLKTYSLQRGEKTTRAEEARYLAHTGLGLQINTSDVQVSGSFVAQSMIDGASMYDGVANVQTLTIGGTPTGGTYVLSFKGAETSALQFNANAAAIQAALRALSTINGTYVTVTGTGPFTVTFSGAMGVDPQPLIKRAVNSLTGGTSPDVTVAETTHGGYSEHALVPILPQHFNVYLATTQAGLDAGRLTKSDGIAATGIEIADRYNPFFALDRDLAGTFAELVESAPKFQANLVGNANSTVMGLLTALRQGARRWLRIEAVGPVIGSTSDTHKFIFEGAVKVADGADFGNEDGRKTFPWPLVWTMGPNGEIPFVRVENGVISY